MNELFKIDISKLDDLQLADWIKKCRSAIKQSDDPKYKENTTLFYEAVVKFCVEWEQHAQIYEEVYKSEKYQTAILANGIGPDVFTLSTPDGEYNISEIMYRLTCYPDIRNYHMVSQVDSYRDDRFKEIQRYKREVNEALSLMVEENKEEAPVHRSAIKKLIINRRQHNVSNFTLLKNEHLLATHDIDELLRNMKEYKKESYPVRFSETAKRPSNAKENKRTRAEGVEVYYLKDVLEDLRSYEITKQVYFDYVNGIQKDYNKKLFGALCFYLSLNLDLAENLYNLNGYTIKNSREPRDIILTQCFRLGFPLVYANALLAKADILTLNSREFPTKKPLVTILDFESELKHDNNFVQQLRFAISHISKFLAEKEKSVNGHKQKAAYCRKNVIKLESQTQEIETDILVLKNEIKFLQDNLQGNKGRLKRAQVDLRKKQRTLDSCQRKIDGYVQSATLHENAIISIAKQHYEPSDYLGYDNTFYNNRDLTDIEILKGILLELQVKYDRPEYLTH